MFLSLGIVFLRWRVR
ncbi:MAG: hypothetical protein ACETWM_22210 [Candidatus Lokiarchaeia archaeon]